MPAYRICVKGNKVAKYDIVILGAGPGGYIAAIRAAQMGAKVAVIEKDQVGGTCLNWGCIPTKALVRSGRVAATARSAAEYGVTVGEVTVDYGVMAARKDKVVSILRGGIESLFKTRGIRLVRGAGRLVAKDAFEVDLADGGKETISGNRLIIATGSRPACPKMFCFDDTKVITSDAAVAKTSVGKSVLIVGGGFIGCEYASMYANIGLEVTIVELLDDILSTMDEAIIKEITRGLKKRKIKVRTGTRVEKLEATETGITACLSGGDTVQADFALISVGRVPVTAGLGLEEVGVEMDRNQIKIDDHCRTNIDSIYAIGDATGKFLLAHVASEQGIVAVENIMGRDVKMDYSVVPACVFTDPEAATVGITEKQAREQGLDYKVGSFPMRGLGKAHADGHIDGLAKVICDAKTGRVLGVHIVGSGASEMIAEAGVAIRNGLSADQVINTIHAHPTMPEALKEAFENFEGKAIHLP